MVELPNNNDGYLNWTAAHSDGYVINIQRSLNPIDARLHRASCHWVNGAPPRGQGFIGSYIKVCSDSLDDLSNWVTERVGSAIRSCGTCRPLAPGSRAAGFAVAGPSASRLGGRDGGGNCFLALAPATGGLAPRPWAPMAAAAAGAEADVGLLVEACRSLPVRRWGYEEHDYITNVLLTVLDLMMRNAAVERSIRYYREHRWHEVRTLDDLEALLGRHADDREGNRQVARYLWGNDHWTRAGWLRGLATFLATENLRTQEQLRLWAHRSDYKKDFAGRVPYLGPAAYNWLAMRLGVDTVKPDVHVRRFAEDAIGHSLTDAELVRTVTAAARALGRSPRELDAAIWERGALGAGH